MFNYEVSESVADAIDVFDWIRTNPGHRLSAVIAHLGRGRRRTEDAVYHLLKWQKIRLAPDSRLYVTERGWTTGINADPGGVATGMKRVYFVTNEQLAVQNVAGHFGNTSHVGEANQWGWHSRDKAEAAAEAMTKKFPAGKFFVCSVLAVAETTQPPVKLTRVEE